GDDKTERAYEHELAAAYLIDKKDSDHGKRKIHDPQAERRCQRCFIAKAGHAENARRVIKDGVNARNLVKKGDQYGQLNREAIPSAEHLGAARLFGIFGIAVYDILHFLLKTFGIDDAKDVFRFLIAAAVEQQPARAFGHDL